ncbi:recombinase family protein [Priestia megaterium]
MEAKKFGYIRVSSKDQNEARQIEAMKKEGIEERDIFIDKQSGKNFDRPNYQIVKRILREGDILFVTSIDRFGRNKEDILNEWNDITKNIKANIVVMDMPLLKTTDDEYGAGKLINDLVLQILSWLAEEERNRIKKRQREGIDVALKRGVKFGRPKVQITDEFVQVYNRWKNKELSAVAAMKELGVKKDTFYRRVKEYENQLDSKELLTR